MINYTSLGSYGDFDTETNNFYFEVFVMSILLLFIIYTVDSETSHPYSAASAMDHNLSKLNLIHNPSYFLNLYGSQCTISVSLLGALNRISLYLFFISKLPTFLKSYCHLLEFPVKKKNIYIYIYTAKSISRTSHDLSSVLLQYWIRLSPHHTAIQLWKKPFKIINPPMQRFSQL